MGTEKKKKKKGDAADEGVRGRGGVIMKSGSALCHLAGFHSVHFLHLFGALGHQGWILSN